MIARVLFVGTLLAALAGTSALAAPRRVRGGIDPTTAPLLPRSGTDVIAAGETLYYAARLEEGQRLHVEAVVVPRGRSAPVSVHLRVYDPQRKEDVFAHEPAVTRGTRRVRLSTATGAVGSSPDYRRPGRHYVSVGIDFLGRRVAGTYRLHVKTRVQATDPVQAEGRPTGREAGDAGVWSRWPLYVAALGAGALLGWLIVTVRLSLTGRPRALRGL